ncbi:hypothetical protein [Salinilacihabitans rarus]|uniref:hypothetical protein n=1 Tax=Salinilacihabitans rarus TaxID=2961596 RepID=UPI0020C8E423|nr:hypothetical protein [Salinilacihabitans rarus]
MSREADRPWSDISRFSSVLDHLADEGGFSVRGMIADLDEEIDVDGVVYHDRGIRVPGHDATFVWEPGDLHSPPRFSVEVDTVGPRSAWAVFDAEESWDFYLLRSGDLAALAWMSDAEFEAEEARTFATKGDAVAAGRFSFGIFLRAGEAWRERVDLIRSTDSPAFLKRDDGQTVLPRTQSEFYTTIDSSPEDLRETGAAPGYLGLLEFEVSIAD